MKQNAALTNEFPKYEPEFYIFDYPLFHFHSLVRSKHVKEAAPLFNRQRKDGIIDVPSRKQL